jgi:hypothetical protein
VLPKVLSVLLRLYPGKGGEGGCLFPTNFVFRWRVLHLEGQKGQQVEGKKEDSFL